MRVSPFFGQLSGERCNPQLAIAIPLPFILCTGSLLEQADFPNERRKLRLQRFGRFRNPQRSKRIKVYVHLRRLRSPLFKELLVEAQAIKYVFAGYIFIWDE